MNKFAITAAALSALVATPVVAQSFTGPRVEARVGYDNFENSRAEGVTYGGGLGYDFAIAPAWRLGAEVGVEDTSANERTGRYRADAGRDLSVGARLGYVANDRVLLYTSGGYTNQRLTVRGPGFRLADNADGWRVGGGAEYALSPRSYVRAEYRHSDYEGDGGGRNQGIVAFGIRM